MFVGACSPHDPRAENDSIPIEYGPASFNAFYRQCSGINLIHPTRLIRRSIADRILDVIDNYHNVQQDILETFVDRGQLRKLAEPTVLPNGKRIPGLKLDHPRQLALMHALLRFSHIAAQNTFTTAEIYADTLAALEVSPTDYSLASLRYDLSKLRAKGLVEKVPHSRRYRLLRKGYSICLVFLKLFERIYAPLTAGLLAPVPGDSRLQRQKRSQLDRLYQRVADDLDKLMDAVGLKAA